MWRCRIDEERLADRVFSLIGFQIGSLQLVFARVDNWRVISLVETHTSLLITRACRERVKSSTVVATAVGENRTRQKPDRESELCFSPLLSDVAKHVSFRVLVTNGLDVRSRQ